MKITKFDRTNLEHLRKEIEDNLTSLFEKYGLTVDIGNIRFGSTEFRTKLTVNVPVGEENETTEETARRLFRNDALSLCVSPNAFGKVFTYAGSTYKVVALKPRSRKYPVVGESASGKRYKFPLSVIEGSK